MKMACGRRPVGAISQTAAWQHPPMGEYSVAVWLPCQLGKKRGPLFWQELRGMSLKHVKSWEKWKPLERSEGLCWYLQKHKHDEAICDRERDQLIDLTQTNDCAQSPQSCLASSLYGPDNPLDNFLHSLWHAEQLPVLSAVLSAAL